MNTAGSHVMTFAAAGLIAIWAVAPGYAAAPEFRMETELYVGDAAEPSDRTVTLFEESAVYEFIESPPQVIVYRQGNEEHAGQFVLLDVESKRRTDVEVKRVEKLMEKLTRWASEQEDPLLKFSAAPTFDESFDEATGDLTLAHKEWTYRVATVPADDVAALARFRDFTDRYAELSAMMYSSPPPRPRLALNAALAKHGVVPVEIRRTLDGDESKQVRAAHMFSWRLSRPDRARLDEARQQLASFEKVDNKAYLAARGKAEVVRGQSR